MKTNKVIKVATLLGLIVLFFYNVLSFNDNIFTQIGIYFVFFAFAILSILVQKKVANGVVSLSVFAFYLLAVTVIAQSWSVRITIINFGYVTLWIWISIIFENVFKTEGLENRDINLIAIFEMVISIYMFFNFGKSRILGNWGFVNNCYYALFALPLLLLVKNRWLKNISVIVVCLVVLYSFKRTAILSLCLIMISYIVFHMNRKRISIKSVFLIAVIICLYVYRDKLFQLIGVDFFYRFDSEDVIDGNGRLDIYFNTFEIINNESIFKLLFGSGYNALINSFGFGISAHNDYLELLVDYGIVGLICFSGVILHYFRICIYHIRAKTVYAWPCIVSLDIFIIVSIFSHCIIYPSYFMFMLLFWKYMEREKYKKC